MSDEHLEFLREHNIYDNEENHLAELQQWIIDEIVRLRDALTPDGYVMVPVEPTENMLDRMMGGAEYRKVGAHLVWRRNYTVMIRAALKGDTQ
jgi:hypothetical protein